MLLGTYQVKFAAGHRIAIPAPLRKDLGETLIIARWYEGCLVLLGRESWEALYKRLTGEGNLIITPVRQTERFVMGAAYEVPVDAQGRIVVPQPLLDYARLGEEIYLIGLGEKVEIWDKKAWEAKEAEVVKNAAEFIEELGKRK